MIEPTYTIEADAADEFLRLTLVGDWNLDVSTRFATDVALAIRGMVAAGARPGHFRTLVDMRRKNLLPQTVATEFAKMVRPDSPSKRIAMLVSGAIHRMQAKRLSTDRHATFDTEEEAMAWLMDLAAPPRAWPPRIAA